jgi:hypothetical protein
MAAWSFAPVAALGAHHAVRQKFSFLHQHQFVLAHVDDRTLRAENIWQQADQSYYGWLCLAALLIPVLCCFLQHLGLPWWWRTLVGIIVCAPALWYAKVALQIFGKVIAPVV